MNTGIGRSFLLTRSQELIWAGQKFDPGAPHYNMVLTFELLEKIDETNFQLAFQALVNESDAMRTVFPVTAGIPRQLVLQDMTYRIEVLEWRDTAKSIPDFHNWVRHRSQITFNLAECTFDSALVRLADKHYVWYLNQHHLTTDAWAVSVLYQRMVQLYTGIEESKRIEGPMPLFQDYIDLEGLMRSDTERSAVNDYWKGKISKQIALPVLYGRTGFKPTTVSDRISIDLGIERSNNLRNLTAEPDLRAWTQHLSLFNIFATVLFAYLYRVSGMRNLAIGTPAHNRITPAFKETPGLFIEVFPLLAQLKEEETFSSLLEQVRTEMHNFLKFAQPGASTPDLSRSFSIVLNYIHATFSDFNQVPMKSEWIHPGHCDPGHHLRLQVYDFDASGSIQLHFDINNNAFIDEIKDLISEHYINLLDAFIEDRSQPVERPSLLTDVELVPTTGFSSGQKSGDTEETTIVELFNRQVQLSSDFPAMMFEGETISYRRLDEMSNQVAHYLHQSGIGAEKRVAVYLKRSPDFIVCVLGVLKAGAAYVPIASGYPAARVEFMLDDAQTSMILTVEELGKGLSTVIPTLSMDADRDMLANYIKTWPAVNILPESLAYIMYTSGSTGKPKGAMISHRALCNYLQWARDQYITVERPNMPLFTMIGFDLTVTSMFLPLVSGGTSVIFPEEGLSVDLSVLKVIEDNSIDIIKLTPSHLALLKDSDLSNSRIKTMIVGGEQFTTAIAGKVSAAIGPQTVIYNEYGPTEATVGCTVHKWESLDEYGPSVPIGKTIANMHVYVLDKYFNQVPQGVTGELFVAGIGLAEGYWNQPGMTAEKFVSNPFIAGTRMYRTGDMGRINASSHIEFMGRADDQVKIGGIRIELGEIESALSDIQDIGDCVVVLHDQRDDSSTQASAHCSRCGLPSNYPNATFNDAGVCHLCSEFESYKDKAKQYFKTTEDLKALFELPGQDKNSNYDCMMLLSGGKDSTYALAQLVEMDLRVLAFTLDNGYISDEAKANITRVVSDLGVDHIYGSTPAMNEIFVDSLKRHSNVCNGCFKVVYTLSAKLALEKDIPYIVTGLSRGQFFETRLTEELFWKDEVDVEGIDQTILNARMAYHRVDDAVHRLMDVSMFNDDAVFEKVKFLDFYRYSDVSLDDMMTYLDSRLPWIRPTDTGRSTNCLINQVGIHVHKKEQGYSNYAFPYSWDVRIGHKTREETLAELDEEIDEGEVNRIMEEIEFDFSASDSSGRAQLVAYYTGSLDILPHELKQQLAQVLPDFMVPSHYRHLDVLPLSSHGKKDRRALQEMYGVQSVSTATYTEPETQIQEMLAAIWQDVLRLPQVGIHDNFLDLGGHSLAAIRITARMNEAFQLDLPLSRVFEMPTVATLATYIEETILALMEKSSNDF